MKQPCNRCSEPGHCCKRFVLNLPVLLDSTPEEFNAELKVHGLPFLYKEHEEFTMDNGEKVTAPTFYCPKLGPKGRCTIYKNRPQACRTFQPLSSPLCVMYQPKVEA